MATFDDLLAQMIALLQRDGHVTYRALQRRLEIDSGYLADLTAEIIKAKRLAVDEDGEVLVWVGEQPVASSQHAVISSSSVTEPQPPVSYTPAHLADRIRAVTVTDGERKTITALFADLKGSTALIEGLDPEEARAVIDPALQLMMDAVHQYDGCVAQALGDSIFALFGAPLAHEDHPQRALYAALRMQEAMRRYADTLRQKGYCRLRLHPQADGRLLCVQGFRADADQRRGRRPQPL